MRPVLIVFLVATLVPSAYLRADRVTAKPATMKALLASVEPNVVSIRLKRVEDLPEAPRSRGERQRLRLLPEEDQRDLADYRKRPDSPFTGLLLDREGHVLTTFYNVLEKVEDIRVRVDASHELEANLLASAPHDDLALLKIVGGVPEAVDVPGVHWAKTADFHAGRYVLALGRAPDPARMTMTLGIVSSPIRNFRRLFQTDAALNYGNVGGPLVGLDGSVYGISAFVGHVYLEWGFNSGVGFGVRADRIEEILPAMKRGETVPHPPIPFVGVGMADNSDDVRLFGARIGRVLEDSAAAAAGIEVDDVVVEWDGLPVYDFMHLRYLIFQRNAGDEVDVVVKRDGESVDLKIKLGRKVPEFEPRWATWRNRQ